MFVGMVDRRRSGGGYLLLRLRIDSGVLYELKTVAIQKRLKLGDVTNLASLRDILMNQNDSMVRKFKRHSVQILAAKLSSYLVEIGLSGQVLELLVVPFDNVVQERRIIQMVNLHQYNQAKFCINRDGKLKVGRCLSCKLDVTPASFFGRFDYRLAQTVVLVPEARWCRLTNINYGCAEPVKFPHAPHLILMEYRRMQIPVLSEHRSTEIVRFGGDIPGVDGVVRVNQRVYNGKPSGSLLEGDQEGDTALVDSVGRGQLTTPRDSYDGLPDLGAAALAALDRDWTSKLKSD